MAINWTYDEIVLAAELVYDNSWHALGPTKPRVKELSELLRAAQIHPVDGRDPRFRSHDSIGRKTSDIATRHPDYRGIATNGNRLDSEVLAEFIRNPEIMKAKAAAIRWALTAGETVPFDPSVDDHELEGGVLLAVHLRRERSKRLRARKLRAVAASGRRLDCEVCGFNFEVAYGNRGEGYVEVHHVLPLHVSGEVKTKLSDLALLCANCHRMAHRTPWMDPNELRGLIGDTSIR